MVWESKRKKKFKDIVDRTKTYSLADAIVILKKAQKVKFDETVEISVKLNVDPKESGQTVRGTVRLPHGTGKIVRVAVFCKGEHETKAKEAGAEFIGAEELIKKVQDGWCDFDVAIATPDMMRDLAKLGKILGPRGLMPSPKSGTVTVEIAKTIQDVKAGKIEYKMDKQSDIHAPVGKLSFKEEAIGENCRALIGSIINASPQRVQNVRSIFVSSTMGPGVRLDLSEFKKG